MYILKDIISEYYDGYNFQGRFPSSKRMKPKYYFQSGIQNWWQKHFSWSIIVKMNINAAILENQHRMTKNLNQIYSLCLIPLVGLVLATIVFSVVEHSVCCLFFQRLKLGFNLFKRLVLNALNFNKLDMINKQTHYRIRSLS